MSLLAKGSGWTDRGDLTQARLEREPVSEAGQARIDEIEGEIAIIENLFESEEMNEEEGEALNARIEALGEEHGFPEWILAAPPRKTISGLDGQLAKVAFLNDLGAANLGPSVLPAASLEHFNRLVLARRPAAIATIREPRRTLELACFLRLQLMRVTDTGLTLVDHRIAAQ